MSINITVAKNQINAQPRRIVLSDIEQIKKNERDRRKRLRLEQVRQQSKERSSQILERAKLIEQQELESLKNDLKFELNLLHNQRLQNIQQKYHEDMENIGQAHISAALQPNVDEILESNRERNRIVAVERGKKATKRLKEINKKKEKERAAVRNRFKNTRESENVRAAMISQLSKVSSNGNEATSSDLSENEDNIVLPKHKNVRHVTAIVHQVDDDENISKVRGQFKQSETSKHKVVNAMKVPRTVVSCESDDQEPRRTVPIINFSASKTDRTANYNPQDYRHPTSEENSSTCTSNSQDSSQSTITQEHLPSSKTPKLATTPASTQVRMYDLSSRREAGYTMPSRIVEKININNEPSAEDQAKEITRSESYFSQLNEIRKAAAENRGKDALLREKVRRDYDQLLRTLDYYSSEERKLKASQVLKSQTRNTHMHPNRKKECLRKRQQKIERNIESIMRTKHPTVNEEPISTLPPERVITTTKFTQDVPPISRLSFPNETSAVPTSTNQSLHYENVLEMLLRLERTKYKLWLEYGTSLPESISSVTQRPLWNKQLGDLIISEEKESKKETNDKTQVSEKPEIRVINVSLEKEMKKKKKKELSKEAPRLSEIAVQTSIDNGKTPNEVQDKSLQVEISKDQDNLIRDQDNIKNQHALDPIVKIVAQTENVDSGSSISTVTDIVIDVDDKQVKVTPKTKHKKPKLSVVTRRLNRSQKSGKSAKKSAVVSTPKLSKSSSTSSTVKKTVDKATSPRTNSEIENQTSVESLCSSTEISKVYTTNLTPKEGAPYTIQARKIRRILKIRQTSDSSTSYASPPVARKGTHLPATNTSTPILDILDSSRSGTEKIRNPKVSPVSSPETPSPRTMKLASNIPRPTAQRKSLFRYKEKNSGTLGDQPTLRNNMKSAEMFTKQQCNCINPSCTLFHGKSILKHKMKETDKINKMYEELQNMTKGKIASLGELLNKLRDLDPVLMNNNPSADSTSINLQEAQDLIAEMKAVHEVLNKNLLESQKLVNNQAELSSIGPVASTPHSSNYLRGDNLVFDLPSFNRPKIISDEHILTEQTDSVQVQEKDETVARLLNEILKQSENKNKSVPDSDDSSGKQIEEIPLKTTLNGKSRFGPKLLPIFKELSTINEFDTPDTTGLTPSSAPATLKSNPLLSSKKLPTPRTSTPTKAPPENKSTQVVTKTSDNSDSSGLDRAEDSSISPPSSDIHKATSSELSGFTEISGISNGDSQKSIEKQLFEKVSWAGATVKKTRESAALDSSSTSEALPLNIAQRTLPSVKKNVEHSTHHEFSGLTDVSSISLKMTNKSTEQSVLHKARTSTPNIQSSGTTDCSDMTTSPSMELT